jgi:hypothetical protein
MLGAVLGTRIVVLSRQYLRRFPFCSGPPAKPGYKIAAPEQPASASPAEAAEQAAPIETRFAAGGRGQGQVNQQGLHFMSYAGRAAPTRLARIFGVSSTAREHPSLVTTIRQQ